VLWPERQLRPLLRKNCNRDSSTTWPVTGQTGNIRCNSILLGLRSGPDVASEFCRSCGQFNLTSSVCASFIPLPFHFFTLARDKALLCKQVCTIGNSSRDQCANLQFFPEPNLILYVTVDDEKSASGAAQPISTGNHIDCDRLRELRKRTVHGSLANETAVLHRTENRRWNGLI
jgi:hypothetical protein